MKKFMAAANLLLIGHLMLDVIGKEILITMEYSKRRGVVPLRV